jgi:hypothetical protein
VKATTARRPRGVLVVSGLGCLGVASVGLGFDVNSVANAILAVASVFLIFTGVVVWMVLAFDLLPGSFRATPKNFIAFVSVPVAVAAGLTLRAPAVR